MKASSYLGWGFVGYVAVNLAGVPFAEAGVTHSPWGVLTFFTFGGPLIAIAVVLMLDLGHVGFDRGAVTAFVVGMILLGLANFLLLMAAAAGA